MLESYRCRSVERRSAASGAGSEAQIGLCDDSVLSGRSANRLFGEAFVDEGGSLQVEEVEGGNKADEGFTVTQLPSLCPPSP